MKACIISDTHFGDSRCKLLDNGKTSQDYRNLINNITNFTASDKLDYLILNGDVMDFSINPFEDSINKAKIFFQALQSENIVNNIIYIPGNHDKFIWDALEWEINIVNKMRNYESPVDFRRTQPGVLNMPGNSLILPGVSTSQPKEYGDIFLKGLFKNDSENIPISIVYPNLYIKTAKESILVTHGHMLELAWVLLSEILFGEPELQELTIKNLEAYNIPITSLICTGVGQAGDVSKLFYKIQQEAQKNDYKRLRQALDTVFPRIDNLIELPWYAESLDNIALAGLKKLILLIAEKSEPTKGDKHFFKTDAIRDRFKRFFEVSIKQVKDIGAILPDTVIFGHTHESIKFNSPDSLKTSSGQTIPIYNTGGWFKDLGANAEVFFIDETGIKNSISL